MEIVFNQLYTNERLSEYNNERLYGAALVCDKLLKITEKATSPQELKDIVYASLQAGISDRNLVNKYICNNFHPDQVSVSYLEKLDSDRSEVMEYLKGIKEQIKRAMDEEFQESRHGGLYFLFNTRKYPKRSEKGNKYGFSHDRDCLNLFLADNNRTGYDNLLKSTLSPRARIVSSLEKENVVSVKFNGTNPRFSYNNGINAKQYEVAEIKLEGGPGNYGPVLYCNNVEHPDKKLILEFSDPTRCFVHFERYDWPSNRSIDSFNGLLRDCAARLSAPGFDNGITTSQKERPFSASQSAGLKMGQKQQTDINHHHTPHLKP